MLFHQQPLSEMVDMGLYQSPSSRPASFTCYHMETGPSLLSRVRREGSGMFGDWVKGESVEIEGLEHVVR